MNAHSDTHYITLLLLEYLPLTPLMTVFCINKGQKTHGTDTAFVLVIVKISKHVRLICQKA